MNKKLFFLLASLSVSYVQAETLVSRSFFDTDSVAIPETTQYQHFWEENSVPLGGQKSFDVTLFGGASHNSSGLARYFGPFDKDSFTIRENATDANADTFGYQDILAGNFHVDTVDGDFYSTLSFAPTWSVSGAEFKFFYQRCTKYWLSASLPFHMVKTDMHLDEKVHNTGGGANTKANENFNFRDAGPSNSMKAAFKNPTLQYGKIDGPQKRRRFSELKITVGSNWKRTTDYYVQPYLGVVLPMGNKAESTYLFEPIVGNGGHIAFFTGTHIGRKLRESDKTTIFFSGKYNAEHRFSNTQKRSIDPGGKPWGRYLAMHTTDANKTANVYSFGINETTKNVRVSPHFTHIHEYQLHFLRKSFDINLGYRAKIQNPETIELKDAWNNPAIADIVAAGGDDCVPARGINNTMAGAEITAFTPIREHELNLDSAAASYDASHTLFGSLNKGWTKENKTVITTFGTSYTFGTSNATLHHWMLWASCNFDF